MTPIKDLKFTSWNVRGVAKLIKLKQVITRLKQLESSIVFIQETHLLNDELLKVRRRWPGQVFSSCFLCHSRGVYTNHVNNTISDTAGRYLVVQGTLLSENINTINVYGPNDDNSSFFENLFLLIATLPGTVLIAGDFNCTLDPKLERSSGVDTSHSHSRKKLQRFIDELNLCVPWRVQNPSKREFSCFSSSFKTQFCIDYFFSFQIPAAQYIWMSIR